MIEYLLLHHYHAGGLGPIILIYILKQYNRINSSPNKQAQKTCVKLSTDISAETN